MKKSIAMAALALLSLATFGQKKSSSDTRLAGIDAKLEALLAEWKVAGFAVAVVEKDKVVYAKGFGYRDYDKKLPATANTLFAIGSCSKAFTSALLGMLREDKQIDFNERPGTYAPNLKFYSDDMDEDLTVADLMCHRTGLPRHDFSWYLFNTDSKDSLIKRVQFQEPSAGVRQKWQYNNFMFLAQGVIAEKITGKSWEDNIREKIFTPLSMNTANLSMAEMEKSSEPSLGYEVKNNTTISKMDYYHISGMAPAGSINSSVTEMAQWVKTWIYGGKLNGKQVIPASYVNEAMSSQMVINAALPSKEHPDVQFANYGYGWFLASYKGHYRVEHGGNIDGFSASTSFFPSDSLGIVVLANQNGSAVPSIVRNMIADRMLKVSVSDWSKELKESREKARKAAEETTAKAESGMIKGTKPSHLLEQMEGKYYHPGYGALTIKVLRDSLFATAGKRRLWLKHFHYDVFQPFELEARNKPDTTEKSPVRINFRTGLDGEVEGATISGFEPSVKPLEFVREPMTKTITAEALQQYVGEYDLSGMVSKVSVKGSSLTLFVPGQPEYDLIFLGDHKFAIKNLTGYKLAFEETDKRITGVSFIQPNGTFKAKRK